MSFRHDPITFAAVLAAAVLTMTGVVSSVADRPRASVFAAVTGVSHPEPGGLRHAVMTADDEEPDDPTLAWAQLSAAMTLARSAEANLLEAQAARDTAAAIVQALREDAGRNNGTEGVRKPVREGLPAQLQFAEGELALADTLVESAHASSQSALAVLEAARRAVLRLPPSLPGTDGQDGSGDVNWVAPRLDFHNAGAPALRARAGKRM